MLSAKSIEITKYLFIKFNRQTQLKTLNMREKENKKIHNE